MVWLISSYAIDVLVVGGMGHRGRNLLEASMDEEGKVQWLTRIRTLRSNGALPAGAHIFRATRVNVGCERGNT